MTAAVLDIVESLTGYPRDLLDLDLDLEADLGVDTVKQAEVFAAVRERFAIPRLDSLKLRDFPTLTHVIGFAREHAPQAARPAEPAVEAAKPAASEAAKPPTTATAAETAETAAAGVAQGRAGLHRRPGRGTANAAPPARPRAAAARTVVQAHRGDTRPGKPGHRDGG